MARIRGLGEGAWLVKPLTFMNLSGRAVGDLQRFFKVSFDDLLIVVDEVHLPTGHLRVRPRGSAGGHNGLKSIIEALGTDAFPRLRVGVGRGDTRRDLADHVLARVAPDERATLEEATRAAADAAELFITTADMEIVMRRINRRVKDAAADSEPETDSRSATSTETRRPRATARDGVANGKSPGPDEQRTAEQRTGEQQAGEKSNGGHDA